MTTPNSVNNLTIHNFRGNWRTKLESIFLALAIPGTIFNTQLSEKENMISITLGMKGPCRVLLPHGEYTLHAKDCAYITIELYDGRNIFERLIVDDNLFKRPS